jgi:hypothetical protein
MQQGALVPRKLRQAPMSKQTLWTTAAVTVAFASWPLAALLSGGQVLPGLPIAEEPHHHLVFQNGYVRVYEVEVPPHAATLEHQHVYDNLFVVFGEARLTNEVAGRPQKNLDLPNLAIDFGRAPYSHVIQNDGDHAFRNVTVELLHRQGRLQKFSPSLETALAKDIGRGRTVRQTTVLRTDEMRLRAVDVSSGSSWSVPHDGHDRLLIFVDKIDNPGPRQKNAPFPAGMIAWIPADHDWNIYKAGRRDMKLMVLDFADSSGKNTFGHLQQVGRQDTSPQVQ